MSSCLPRFSLVVSFLFLFIMSSITLLTYPPLLGNSLQSKAEHITLLLFKHGSQSGLDWEFVFHSSHNSPLLKLTAFHLQLISSVNKTPDIEGRKVTFLTSQTSGLEESGLQGVGCCLAIKYWGELYPKYYFRSKNRGQWVFWTRPWT